MTRGLQVSALALAALVGRATAALADPSPPESRPLRVVLDESGRSQRPLLLYFSEEWCEPCRTLEQTLFRDPALRRAVSQFVFQKYDTSVGIGWDLSNRFRVNSIPTLVIVDGNGVEQARRTGGGPDLASWLDQQAATAAQDRRRILQRVVLERLLFGIAVPVTATTALALPEL